MGVLSLSLIDFIIFRINCGPKMEKMCPINYNLYVLNNKNVELDLEKRFKSYF